MRLLDGDKLVALFERLEGDTISVTDAAALIDNALPVCCAECIKWTDQRSPWNADLRLCNDFPAYMSANAGCSFFERKSHD